MRSSTATLARSHGRKNAQAALSPISLHDFPSPFRLFNVAARPKTRHHRLNVEDGAPGDGVEILHMQSSAGNPDNPANRHANPVWSIAPSLREYANLRPICYA
jgi:hypothetical protein